MSKYKDKGVKVTEDNYLSLTVGKVYQVVAFEGGIIFINTDDDNIISLVDMDGVITFANESDVVGELVYHMNKE